MSTHVFLAAPRGGGRDPRLWTDTLRAEWRHRSLQAGVRGPVRSIFVEAGSAQVLGASLARRVREVLEPFEFDRVREWTVEVETAPIPADWLKRWAAGGVTRLSLRGEAATEDAVDGLVRTHGRSAIHLDLGVEVALGGGEAGANLARKRIRSAMEAGATSVALTEPGPDRTEPAMDPAPWWGAIRIFEEAGWEVPELSMAHSPGHLPLYAMALARRAPVVGLGPGGISFRHPVREWNHPAWGPYLASVRASHVAAKVGQLRAGAQREVEVLTRAEARLERIWMALRTDRGLPLPMSLALGRNAPTVNSTSEGEGAFEEGGRAGYPRPAGEGRRLQRWAHWQRLGWIRSPAHRFERRVRLTREGWLHADHLAVEIAELLER